MNKSDSLQKEWEEHRKTQPKPGLKYEEMKDNE